MFGPLCFLLLILIAVISSKRIRGSAGKVFEWIVYTGSKLIFSFLFGIIVIIGLWLLITWGWNKLHEIYPKIWSLKEIIWTGLLFAGLIAVNAFIKFADDELKGKYGEGKVKKIYDGIKTAFAHIVVDSMAFVILACIAGTAVYLLHKGNIGYVWCLYIFGLYLLIKYFILIFVKRKN